MSTRKKTPKFVYELTHPFAGRLMNPEAIEGGVYLFLNEAWHVNAWVEGGTVPIALASSYLASERRGTKTLDENLIHDSPVDISAFHRSGTTLVNCSFGSPSYVNGVIIPPVRNVSIFKEDGIILSFSKRRGREQAERFGGKKACVRILDIRFLKRIIDEQLKVIGKLGDCVYTDDHRRNHFLKSSLDSWQEEIRLFWRMNCKAEVVLPAGVATLVEYY